jgi:hypothetical protein
MSDTTITPPPLERLKDWRQRLDDYLDGIGRRPFQWGDLDCALFVADAVHAMTGVDFAGEFRGRYSDQDGAKAAVLAAGFADYAELVAAKLPEGKLGEGRIGDIAVVETPDFGPCLAIIGGAHLTCMTLRGKGSLPLTKASRIFKVG